MELRGKKVLVVGLGKSGLAAALFLRHHGAEVTVSDRRSAESLAREIPSLIEAGVSVETGGHGLLTFRRQDLIVLSPGVPLNTTEIEQAHRTGIPVIGELELASRFLKGKVLAITGSNGKTTTTSLCGEIFKAGAGNTLVAGNIGLPAISVAEASGSETWTVLEVSSFQLETTFSFHPRIAVILNITPDHLDRHGTFENYVAIKEKIFANQNQDDALVLNGDDPAVQQAASRANTRVFWFSRTKVLDQGAFLMKGAVVFRPSEYEAPQPIFPVSAIPLKGEHNVENVLAAVCAACVAGIPAEAIAKSVAAFHPVEHRLEFVASIGGVEYYNDSKATNVDATVKAIRAFPGNIHLILGGKDKGSDYSELNILLRERVKAVYTIGAASEKIARQVGATVPLIAAGTLDAAVNRAAEAAEAGDIVLLAPACASFDQFDNFEHRGRVFKKLVSDLREREPWPKE